MDERTVELPALWVAVTSRDLEEGSRLLPSVADLPVGIKVGLELYLSGGAGAVRRVREHGLPIFLDLKLHDIPFTAAGAVTSLLPLRPELLNVHASGGVDMMRAAAEAAAGSSTRLLAVTVLTSLDRPALRSVGLEGDPGDIVPAMAAAAMEAGLHGVVCSPVEARPVREATSPGFLIVTPGVRPAGSRVDDQRRVATPSEAMAAGADALVVGRPVTRSDDPRRAVLDILSGMGDAPAGRG